MTKYIIADENPNIIHEKCGYIRKLSIKKRKKYDQKYNYDDIKYLENTYSINCY